MEASSSMDRSERVVFGKVSADSTRDSLEKDIRPRKTDDVHLSFTRYGGGRLLNSKEALVRVGSRGTKSGNWLDLSCISLLCTYLLVSTLIDASFPLCYCL